jgi:CubicO group peptidase (beta-lactamase class C family)
MIEDLTQALQRSVAEFVAGEAPPLRLSFAAFDRDGVLEVGSVHDGDTWLVPDETPGRFRVASLTKSFTAAAILRLRDRGNLSLDDSASRYVPEMGEWSLQPTLRQLLTMTGGLVTDNPWADRLQQTSVLDLREWLAGGEPGVRFPVGTFEYSNLGYAILGLVLTEVADAEYSEVIERWFLAPLEMTDSSFTPDENDPRFVPGYIRKDNRWQLESFVGHGALSPMGGLVSTAPDVVRWATFLSSGFSGRNRGGDEILGSESRRQMQTVQASGRSLTEQTVIAPNLPIATGYGFGLRVLIESGLGTFAGHAGGYPGYGAHMWWHPASGHGLVILANSTYCPVWDVTQPVLRSFVAETLRGNTTQPSRWLTATQTAVDRLIDEWSVEAARELISHNVDADRSLDALGDEVEDLQQRYGPFGPAFAEEVNTPGQMAWRRSGQNAEISVSALLDPGQVPRVQDLQINLIPELSTTRRRLLHRLIQAMDGVNVNWPRHVEVADRFAGADAFAVASVLYGPLTLDHLISNTATELTARVTTRIGEPINMFMTLDGNDRIERFDVLRSAIAPIETSQALD